MTIRSASPRTAIMLMVTFDLDSPVGGDARYRRVDRYLGAIGNTLKPFKQTRFVITTSTAGAVRAGLRSIIGRRGNIGVMRVSRRSRVDIGDPIINAAVRNALRRFGSP